MLVSKSDVFWPNLRIPILTHPSNLEAYKVGNLSEEEDQLGWSVAIQPSTFVVGAPGYKGNEIPLSFGSYWAGRGRAVVMGKNVESNGDGEWVEEGVLEPSVADDNADFGNTVDIAQCECLIAVGVSSLSSLCAISIVSSKLYTHSMILFFHL